MKKGKTTYQRLDDLRQKGAAWQSTTAADKMQESLRFLLTNVEYWALATAREHYKMGEGAAEFYDIINKLISKYRQADVVPVKKTLL